MVNPIVENFWIKPENPQISGFNQFSFGYKTKGRDYSYQVSTNPAIKDSLQALHEMFWKVRDSKKRSYLPWTTIPQDIKSKLIITNPDDPQTSFLPELLDKVANRLEILQKLRQWF